MILAASLFTFAAIALEPGEKVAPFITETRVIYPQNADRFKLKSDWYDADHVSAGIDLTYAVRGWQDAKLDVFVYPAGRMEEGTAVAAAMAEMTDGMRQAQEMSLYKNVKIGPARAVSVDVPLERTLHGQVVPVQLTTREGDVESRGAVFYLDHFFVKVRLSASAPAGDRLDKTFRGAMDAIIPRLRIRHVGNCGAPKEKIRLVRMPAEMPENAVSPLGDEVRYTEAFATEHRDEFQRNLRLAMLRRANNPCVSDFDAEAAKVSRNEKSTQIVFPPDAWLEQEEPGKREL